MNEESLRWPARERAGEKRRGIWEEALAEQDKSQPGASGEDETPPALVFPANRVYVPYENRGKPDDLIFFFAAKLPAKGAAYHHLATYDFDQFHGRFFILYYPFMTVKATGPGVLEILYHIIGRKCAIIREWHRDRYDPPPRGKPVIESLTVTPFGEEGQGMSSDETKERNP